MKEIEVKFESLLGEHYLSGVEMGTMPKEDEYDYEDPNTVDFIIDGKTYSAIEDPEDGYRSCLSRLIMDRPGVDIKNTFRKVKVIGRMSDDSEYETNDILEFIDAKNGKTILRIGTGNTNDYYPYFVGQWTPENMFVNESRK